MSALHVPVRFAGSEEERAANRATHYFSSEDGRCVDCDCRSGGAHADYPCGQSAPRQTVTVAPDQLDATVRASLGLAR